MEGPYTNEMFISINQVQNLNIVSELLSCRKLVSELFQPSMSQSQSKHLKQVTFMKIHALVSYVGHDIHRVTSLVRRIHTFTVNIHTAPLFQSPPLIGEAASSKVPMTVRQTFTLQVRRWISH